MKDRGIKEALLLATSFYVKPRNCTMPISCPFDVRSLSAEEFQKVDYRVMGHAFACQNELGRLCEEDTYQRDLQLRLMADGFESVQNEVPISVSYNDFVKTYFVDLIVDHAVYELKTTATLNSQHQSQLLNYLFLLGVSRGKLISFFPLKVQGQTHATGLTAQDRRRFKFNADRWQDLSPQCCALRQMTFELLSDWGAFLDFRLYEQALTHFFGGESEVLQRLPLNRNGTALGTQRFHIHSPGIAFRVTAITAQTENIESHLNRLLALTGLQGIQWINLNRSNICLTTLTK